MGKYVTKNAIIAGFVVGLVVMLVNLLMAGPRVIGNLIYATLTSAIIAALAVETLSRYFKLLSERMGSTDGPVWDIEMNGVKVGEIQDSEYAKIRNRIFRDYRIYALQLFQLFKDLSISFVSIVYVFPAIVFWIALISEYYNPGTLKIAMNELLKTSSSDVSNGVTYICLLAKFTAFSYVIIALCNVFGFKNCFALKTADELRKYCKCAVEGNVTLVRYANGIKTLNNEEKLL